MRSTGDLQLALTLLTALPALQQHLGFTAVEAAEALGVSLRTYRRWLQHGNPSPTAVRLLAILAGYVPWED